MSEFISIVGNKSVAIVRVSDIAYISTDGDCLLVHVKRSVANDFNEVACVKIDDITAFDVSRLLNLLNGINETG